MSNQLLCDARSSTESKTSDDLNSCGDCQWDAFSRGHVSEPRLGIGWDCGKHFLLLLPANDCFLNSNGPTACCDRVDATLAPRPHVNHLSHFHRAQKTPAPPPCCSPPSQRQARRAPAPGSPPRGANTWARCAVGQPASAAPCGAAEMGRRSPPAIDWPWFLALSVLTVASWAPCYGPEVANGGIRGVTAGGGATG